MICDIRIASDNASFAAPEIKLGWIGGGGMAVNLAHAVGPSNAALMIMTGDAIDAATAERWGLVSRVVPLADLLDEALKTAATIAGLPPMAAKVNKEMVNAAFETTLDQGLLFERRAFQILTATEDKREGMAAFIEKRPGVWKGK